MIFDDKLKRLFEDVLDGWLSAVVALLLLSIGFCFIRKICLIKNLEDLSVK